MTDQNIRSDFAAVLTGDETRTEIVKALTELITSGKVAKFYCEKCKHENAVTVPDNKSRLDAVKLFIDQGLGKVLEAPRDDTEKLWQRFREDVDSLSDYELFILYGAPESTVGEDLYREALRVVERYESTNQA